MSRHYIIITAISIFFVLGAYITRADTNILPGNIFDLTAVSVGSDTVQFTWSAPGADGFVEPASSYDMRMATTSFNSITWNAQTQVSNTPTPGQPGTRESVTVFGLLSNTQYFFAVRGVDSFGNMSLGFNIVAIRTAATGTPSVTNVSFFPRLEGVFPVPASTSFTLSLFYAASSTKATEFTAPSDANGRVMLPGTVVLAPGNYDILVSSPFYLKKKLFNIPISSSANISLSTLSAGDLNSDNIINSLDWSLMSANWFSVIAGASDINKDGIVNSLDWSIMAGNWFLEGDKL